MFSTIPANEIIQLAIKKLNEGEARWLKEWNESGESDRAYCERQLEELRQTKRKLESK